MSRYATCLFALPDRVAMATDGGGSLGSAICDGLADAGAAVAIVATNSGGSVFW